VNLFFKQNGSINASYTITQHTPPVTCIIALWV